MIEMITDLQKKWLMKELEGKIKKGDDPRKYSAYKRRIRARIDNLCENLLWLAEYRPDLLSDRNYEDSDPNISLHRRAKALLKAVTLFENEPTVLSLIAEIYASFAQIEVTRK